MMFHDILHIRSSLHKRGNAEVCPQGCKDTVILKMYLFLIEFVGDDILAYLDTTKPENEWEHVRVYGPGFAKLMAQDKDYGPFLSSHNSRLFLNVLESQFETMLRVDQVCR